MRNALRYSHHHIAVAFSIDNQGVTIIVDDDGPGVSPEDREQYSGHFIVQMKPEIGRGRNRIGPGNC